MLPNAMKKDLIQGLLDIFHGNISMIILYGSVARNEATAESDIDIAIIVKSAMDSETQNKFIAWCADMDLKYDKVFSVIDIQAENMDKWGKILPFYRNVTEEGVVLWKAA